MRGKSQFLVRMPRTNKEHQFINSFEEERKGSNLKIRHLNQEIEKLKYKLQKFEDMQRKNEDNIEKLSNLYEMAIIDEEWHPTNNKIE